MRHMFTLSPKRLGRALLAPAAIGLAGLACLWVGTAAIEQHNDSARFARADLLQTAIDLSHVGAVDSVAVATLLAWQRAAEKRGSRRDFGRLPPTLHSLAELYGVAALLQAPAAASPA